MTGAGIGVAIKARSVASGAGDDVRIGVGVAPGSGVAVGLGAAVGTGVVGADGAVGSEVEVGPGIGATLAGASGPVPPDDFRLAPMSAAAAPIARAPPTIAALEAPFCAPP